MMRYIIERVTENGVICEDEQGQYRKIPASFLPEEAGEGDILTETEGGFILEREETDRRRRRIRQRLEELIQ